MPAWVHDRVKHLQEKNPSMPEGEAWGIATQQAHKLAKTPKSYGTAEGRRVAKKKYDRPKDEYVQTADPKTAGFVDELQKIATEIPDALMKLLKAALLLGFISTVYRHTVSSKRQGE